MIGSLIHLLIILLILGVVCWAVLELAKLVPLPAPFAAIIRILVIVIVALVVIYYGIIPLLSAVPG